MGADVMLILFAGPILGLIEEFLYFSEDVLIFGLNGNLSGALVGIGIGVLLR